MSRWLVGSQSRKTSGRRSRILGAAHAHSSAGELGDVCSMTWRREGEAGEELDADRFERRNASSSKRADFAEALEDPGRRSSRAGVDHRCSSSGYARLWATSPAPAIVSSTTLRPANLAGHLART